MKGSTPACHLQIIFRFRETSNGFAGKLTLVANDGRGISQMLGLATEFGKIGPFSFSFWEYTLRANGGDAARKVNEIK